jgi:hypothetical protein
MLLAEQAEGLLKQICEPFDWVSQWKETEHGIIFVIACKDIEGALYKIIDGEFPIDPYKIRFLALTSQIYLASQGIKISLKVTAELLDYLPKEEFKLLELEVPSVELDPLAPIENLDYYLGARQHIHGPSANPAIAIENNMEYRPGASPRRRLDGRLNY